MADLHWIAVFVVLLASAGTSLTSVDQNQLGKIVEELLNRYKPSYTDDEGVRRNPMFSLVVSIPYDPDKRMYDVSKIIDAEDQVRKTILECKVYTGKKLLAATVLRWPNVLKQCPNEPVQWGRPRGCPAGVRTWADVQKKCPGKIHDGKADHAEYRVVKKFNTLLQNRNRNDFLLFYVLASPCDKRCTSTSNQRSILKDLNQILSWKNYAVVFSDIFKPRNGQVIAEGNLRASLKRLGTYKVNQRSIGLDNIFRCKQGRTAVTCTSCSTRGQVTPSCVSDN